jgi:hypothetical protein
MTAATAAHAGVIADSSNRFVTATISNPVAGETKTAPDANLFNETATADVNFNNTASNTTATQNSTFGVAGDVLTTVITSSGQLATQSLPGSNADADSRVDLNFTLTSAGTFSLLGNASVSGAALDPGFYASYIIRLEGPGGPAAVFDFRDEGLPPGVTSDVFNESGALAAGSYHLIVRALSTGTGFVNARGDLDITFSVDAPGGPAGPGGGGAQAPLPAAVWPAMALGAYVVKRRRA